MVLLLLRAAMAASPAVAALPPLPPLPALPKAVCPFDGAAVSARLELQLVGSSTPFAEASDYGGSPSLRGWLGRAESGAAVLRAELEGSGIRVWADLSEAVEIAQPVPIAEAVLLPGLDVPVRGFAGERVRVEARGEDLQATQPLTTTVDCVALRVRSYDDSSSNALTVAGFGGGRTTLAEVTTLRASAGGRVVAKAEERTLRTVGVLEEGARWTRVAVPDGNLVWLGWMPTADAFLSGVTGAHGVGGLGASQAVAYVACPEPQPLSWLDREGPPVLVGEVAAGTPFSVQSLTAAGAQVRFNRRWLAATSGTFLLPAEAAACPTAVGPP